MSYYDFDHFWTHEEVGGKQSEVLKEAKKFDLIEAISNFISFANNNNQTKSEESDYSTFEQVNYSSSENNKNI